MVLPHSPDGLEAHAAGLELTPAAGSGWRLGLQPADAGSWASDRQMEHFLKFQEERKVPLPVWGRLGQYVRQWTLSCGITIKASDTSAWRLTITPKLNFFCGLNINLRGGHALL